MEEALQNRISIAAPFIFLIVVALQLASIRLEHLMKKGLVSAEEIELRNEIKRLLKEAGSLTNPSTFAQAAKLRRMAASKEKELQKYQSTKNQSKKLSYDTHVKALMIVKALAYLFLVFWFWGAPVATISQQLLQPFGKALSFGAGGRLNGRTTVGVIPWIALSTRVSNFLCHKFLK